MSSASARGAVHGSGDQGPRQSFGGPGEVVVMTQTEGCKMEGAEQVCPRALCPQVSQWDSVAA